MTRESRANLIFVVILVLLITPGFIFLMKKKLNGSSRPNFMPEPAPYRIAYIQPLPAPPLPRKQPASVRDWVTSLVEQKLGATALERRRRLYAGVPIVSDQFVTEYVGEFDVNGHHRIVLLRWDDSVNLSTAASSTGVVVSVNGKLPYETTAIERIDVPRDVRHALQDVGFVDPPTHVWWIAADGQPNAAVTPPAGIELTTLSPSGKAVKEVIALNETASPAARPAIEVTP